MDDYVSKPVKPDDLQGALNRYLDRRPAEEPPAPLPPIPPTPALSALPAEHAPAIDLALLDGFRDLEEDGESVLGALIGVFLENSPKLLSEARAALRARAAEPLSRATHTLKGSGSNFGAERLRLACQDLEDAALTGNFILSAELLAAVEREFQFVRAALELECPVPTP